MKHRLWIRVIGTAVALGVAWVAGCHELAGTESRKDAQETTAAAAFKPEGETMTPEKLAKLRTAAEGGDPQAQSELGAYYTSEGKSDADKAEGIIWLRKAAQQKHEGAELVHGLWMLALQSSSFPNRIPLLRELAARNHPEAMVILGDAYLLGGGVPRDPIEAVKWYRKAAEQGDAEAQYNLGVCYDQGEGVPKDPVEAAKWYRKAAEQGHAEAQYNLGVCYYQGEGVPKDLVEAVKWYRKAAEQNLAVAQYNLGICYAKGEGVPKDPVEAVKWFRKAAEQNDVDAQFALGVCYANGLGVPKHEVEAYKWFLLAVAQGVDRAKKAVDLLEQTLTREQIAEGQKLAREFWERHVEKKE